jgi:hypothetical protein
MLQTNKNDIFLLIKKTSLMSLHMPFLEKHICSDVYEIYKHISERPSD